MSAQTTQTSSLLFSLLDDGFTAVARDGVEIGIYKEVDDHVVAIRHCGVGRSFKVFNGLDDAIHWLLRHYRC